MNRYSWHGHNLFYASHFSLAYMRCYKQIPLMCDRFTVWKMKNRPRATRPYMYDNRREAEVEYTRRVGQHEINLSSLSYLSWPSFCSRCTCPRNYPYDDNHAQWNDNGVHAVDLMNPLLYMCVCMCVGMYCM